MNHADIIETKGTKAIAEACRVNLGHVRVWKHRRIPRSAYADIITAFPDVSLDMLRSGEPEAKAA